MNLEDDTWVIKDGVLLKYKGDSKEVVIPDGVRIIGESSFYGLGLRDVTIPDSVEHILSWALSGNNIKELVIPKNVKKIEMFAFSRNPLEKIVFNNSDCNFSVSNGLEECSSNVKIYMPFSLLKDKNKLYSFKKIHNREFVIDCKDVSFDNFRETINNCDVFNSSITIRLTNFNPSYIANLKGIKAKIIIECSSENKKSKNTFITDKYYGGIGLSSYEGESKYVKIPDLFSVIDKNAFSNSKVTQVVLPKNLNSVHNDYLKDSNIETIEIYANGAYQSWENDSNSKLQTIKIIGDDNFLQLGNTTIPDWNFNIYMKIGRYFYSRQMIERSNLKIYIDCSVPNDEIESKSFKRSLYFKEIQETLKNVEGCFSNATIYLCNCNLNRFQKRRLAKKYSLLKIEFTDTLKDIEETKTFNNDNYNSDVEKRVDKIRELISPLNDDEEKSILDIVDELLKKYEIDKENLKPNFDFNNNDVNLQVGPTTVKELNDRLVNSLDSIINKLQANDVYLPLLNNIDYWKRIVEDYLEYDEDLVNDSERLKKIVANPSSLEEKIVAISYISFACEEPLLKKELLDLFNELNGKISSELKMSLNDVITLKTDNVDYQKYIEKRIDEIYVKAFKYNWLIEGLCGLGNSLLAKSTQNIIDIIGLLDEKSKEEFNAMFKKAIDEAKKTDISLSEEEIINWVDELYKPVRKGLSERAYYSIRLRSIINDLIKGKALIDENEEEFNPNDLISSTILEVLEKTPDEISTSVKEEILRIIEKWLSNLTLGNIDIADIYINMDYQDELLTYIIQLLKQTISNGDEEKYQEKEKTIKLCQDIIDNNYVAVINNSNDKQYVRLMAIYLTVLKDFYALKFRVDSYVSEKNQYESELELIRE